MLTSLAAHGKPLPPGFDERPELLAVINRLVGQGAGGRRARSGRVGLVLSCLYQCS